MKIRYSAIHGDDLVMTMMTKMTIRTMKTMRTQVRKDETNKHKKGSQASKVTVCVQYSKMVVTYSLVRLVVPNTEEHISQLFMALLKI